jgi:hypothetical protein
VSPELDLDQCDEAVFLALRYVQLTEVEAVFRALKSDLVRGGSPVGYQRSRARIHYQWDAIFADGDMYKAGLQGRGLYISPSRDVVVVYFSTVPALLHTRLRAGHRQVSLGHQSDYFPMSCLLFIRVALDSL